MPLTPKGEEIKSALTKEYGKEKGERVLYAGKNKGTFSGIDSDKIDRLADGAERLSARFNAVMSQSEYKKLVRERDEAKQALIEANKNPQTGNLGVFEKAYTRASGALANAQVQMSKSKWDTVADAVDRLSSRFDARVGVDETKKEYRQRMSEWRSAIKIRINNGDRFESAKTPAEAEERVRQLKAQGIPAEVV